MALLSRRLPPATIRLFALCAVTFSSSYIFAVGQISDEEVADTWHLGSVLELTQQNFSEAVEKHEYLLVNFYAPWCEHCRKLAIEVSPATAKNKICVRLKFECKRGHRVAAVLPFCTTAEPDTERDQIYGTWS